jgi:hypothetical protein
MAVAIQNKNVGYKGATGLGPGYKPRLTRAYAEGRVVGIASGAATLNPEDGLGTPREKAWDHGHTNAASADYVFECAS